MELFLIFVIFAVGFYTAWNIGANDVANAMGTSVGSGALTLKRAVIVAAILEFSGVFFFGSSVSQTIQSGIINLDYFIETPRILVYGMLASLASAGIWLQVASYCGWPVSTTHSIVGAIVGFGLAVGGISAVQWDQVFFIVTSWILSPILGGVISFSIFSIIRKYIFYKLEPFNAAKKLTPYIVFFVILVLFVVMISKGFSNVDYRFSWIETVSIALSIATGGFIISYVALRRVPSTPAKETGLPLYGPEITSSLDKARKSLEKVRDTTKGDIMYQVSLIVEEVNLLKNSMEQHYDVGEESAEYRKVEGIFSYLQIMSACMMAFAHGANDVANAIGPLSAAMSILSTGVVLENAPVPTWALILGGVGIVTGLATWGWRVIETIGKKITELTPSRGFSAEFGAALTVVVATTLGLPVSTTHTLVGAVLGVGLARGLESINLITTRDILISWIVTVPIGAIITIILYYPIQAFFGI